MIYPPFKKYISISRLGHEENDGIFSDPNDLITIQEKIDGGNSGFRLWEGNFLFQTRNNHFTLDNTDSPQRHQFGDNAQYVVNTIQDPTRLNTDYLYFGEFCKKHSINYDWSTMPMFLGFDIYNLETHNYLPWSVALEEYHRLGIPVVPTLARLKVSELKIENLETFIGSSVFYDGLMEGIVIKNYLRKNVYGRQLFAKIVRAEFKELNAVVFGGGIKNIKDDTTDFLNTFYTDSRIHKVILKLLNEYGRNLGRELMNELPKMVIEDILAEEGWEIVKRYGMIKFSIIKKAAPKRCLLVLNKMLSERI